MIFLEYFAQLNPVWTPEVCSVMFTLITQRKLTNPDKSSLEIKSNLG